MPKGMQSFVVSTTTITGFKESFCVQSVIEKQTHTGKEDQTIETHLGVEN
jgi:hypothetical protein